MSDLNQDAERAAPELLPRYDEAVAIVKEQQRASVSLVQRRLRISWNAARDLVELMLARRDVPLEWAPPVYQLTASHRAAPVGEVELPAQAGGRGWIGSVGDYAQFHVLLNAVCDASEELEKAEGREVFAAADKLEKAKDALIAYIDGRTAGAAPEGWKLVPIEPTPEMIAANGTCDVPEGAQMLADDARATWAAMIAAAPSPQHGKEGA